MVSFGHWDVGGSVEDHFQVSKLLVQIFLPQDGAPFYQPSSLSVYEEKDMLSPLTCNG